MSLHLGDQTAMFSDPQITSLRWFLLPSEAYGYLHNQTISTPPYTPFSPTKYPINAVVPDWDNEPVKFISNDDTYDSPQKYRYTGKTQSRGSTRLPDEDVQIVNLSANIEEETDLWRRMASIPMLQQISTKTKHEKVKTILEEGHISHSIEEEQDVWKLMATMGSNVPSELVAGTDESASEDKDVIVASDDGTKIKDKNTSSAVNVGSRYSSQPRMTFSKLMEKQLSEGFDQHTSAEEDTAKREEEEGELQKVSTSTSIVKAFEGPVAGDHAQEDSEPAKKRLKSSDSVIEAASVVVEGHKWHIPPKSTFKPMCEVRNILRVIGIAQI